MHRVALGTMVMGDQLNQEQSAAMVKQFLAASPLCAEIDTAFMYPSLDFEGKAEAMLGQMKLDGTMLSTKINAGTAGGLSAANTRAQFQGSLERLNVAKVDILYLHWPDHKVPILETLAVVAELYREGKFQRFGLSNYAAWQVVEVYHLCEARGWVLPTVYQGMYNCLTRAVESELLVALKKYNITFYAYNITCGGLLSGNRESARFTTAVCKDRYRARYINDSYTSAVDRLIELCQQEGINAIDAGIRWLVHHSKLDRTKDVLVLGASSAGHLDANIESAIKGKPLPESIVQAMDECAAIAKPGWQNYFR